MSRFRFLALGQALSGHCPRLVCLALLALGIGACTPEASLPDGKARPQVVATSTIIADLTDAVGGDQIQLTGILEPGADPHIYEPVPADSVALEKADLILYNGFNLEPGLIKMMNAAGTRAQKLAVGEVVPPLDLDYEGQKVPDPHVWGDVENAIAMVTAIKTALIDLAPTQQAQIQQNADRLIADLQKLDAWVAQQIATIPPNNRQLVTTHDAFQYYAHAYGLQIVGTLIGISTEEQPSAQTIRSLVTAIKNTGVPSIFAETTINPVLITTVAQEAGVQLAPRPLYSDSIGAPGSDGDSYLKMIAANTRTIVEALGGTYTPFQP
ncbi:metal ABC transporter solute-binding protein, Zn/Mn family [Trichothermofontia sp.]